MDLNLCILTYMGAFSEIKRQIQRGECINATNGKNQTPLAIACAHGKIEIAQYLLENGASIDVGSNPLIDAVRFDHYDCVELLLKHHADCNYTNAKGKSPLSIALQQHYCSIVLLLLRYGAVLSPSLNVEVFQFIKRADDEQSDVIAKLLESNIINLTSKGVYLAVFGYAFKHGMVEMAERMLNYSTGNRPTNMAPLYPVAAYYSAKHNWSAILSTLFEKRFDVNLLTKGQTPLYVACEEGHKAVVKLLLINGADPNVPSQPTSSMDFQLPIQLAVHCRNIAVFWLLRRKGADLLHTVEPLLHIACSLWTGSTKRALSMIKLLLEHGVAVNGVSAKGDTALYRACVSQQLEVVEALLEAGADVNLTKSHLYPLIGACETGNAKLINLLLNAGADVRCTNSKDETCLHVVVSRFTVGLDITNVSTTVNMISSFLECGADINAQCSQEETVLYRASRAGCEDVVQLLLEAGAEPNRSSSRSPLYAACEHGHTQIVSLLLKHGADSNLITCGKTALICLIEHLTLQSQTDVMDQELEKQALDTLKSVLLTTGDVNLPSVSDGLNALHIASLYGRCDIMEELIQHGADCNLPTAHGNAALDLACEKNHEAAVQLLLNSGAKPERKDAVGVRFSFANATCSYGSSQCRELALCSAVKHNSETTVKLLIQHGADVNRSYRNGDTALHLSTSSTVIEALLKAGARVNAMNDLGQTALSKVCSETEASVNVVEKLLKFGADPNIKFPLYDACRNNCEDIVSQLLEYGADANLMRQPSWRRTSPLCIACRNRNAPIVDCLLRSKASVTFADEDGNTPLHHAVERLESDTVEDYDPIVTLLLQHEGPVDVISGEGETPLYVACRKGLVGVVRQLLACKANVHHSRRGSDKYPLLIACEKKFTDIALMLLKLGADANVCDREKTPLKFASTNGDIELMKELLAHGADVNQMNGIGDTALHVAVGQPENVHLERFVDIVKMLLKNGAEPNAFNGRCETPLHVAYRCMKFKTSDLDIFQALLEHGADPNLCFPETLSLQYCLPYSLLHSGNTELMMLLIRFGARLDQKDKQGRTALHSAIGYYPCDTSAVRVLLSAGADVNVVDSVGDSPLYLACEDGKSECVKLLLSHNANPNAGTRKKCPLLAACRTENSYHTLKLLLQYNVDLAVFGEDGKTVLHHVLEAKYRLYCGGADSDSKTASVLLLLGKPGVNINAASADGETPLYLASLNGLLSVVDKMVECGAELDASVGQKLPLNAACRNKHLAVVQLLLAKGASPNPSHSVLEIGKEDPHGCTLPLVIAASNCSCELVKELLKHGANVNAADGDGNTALHRAIQNSNSALMSLPYSDVTSTNSGKLVIDILLKNKADVHSVNNRGETPLYIAALKGLSAVVSKMLEAFEGNANKCPPAKHPLTVSCEIQDVQLVDMLLEYGTDPNLGLTSYDQCSTDELPLGAAVRKGNGEIVSKLLKAGAMLNAVNSDRKNILCLAVENLANSSCLSSEEKRKRVATIRLLLEHGADLNLLMPDGHSLLYLAVTSLKSWCEDAPDYEDRVHLIELIQLFVKHGVSLNDSQSQLGEYYCPRLSDAETVRALSTFDEKNGHGFLVDLFRAGTGFQLLGFCCNAVEPCPETVASIRLCQAAVLGGYKPSSKELQEMQEEVSDDVTDAKFRDIFLEKLLDWLNSEIQQVPSLQRQCRVAIRQQLSIAANFRSILPAIEKLSLPDVLKLYLQFDGPMTEVDLSTSDDYQSDREELVPSAFDSDVCDYCDDTDSSDNKYDSDSSY